jgi:hypothetical protein
MHKLRRVVDETGRFEEITLAGPQSIYSFSNVRPEVYYIHM